MNNRIFRHSVLAVAAVSCLGISAPALAQRASLADRVAALEARASNNQANLDLLRQVNQLKTEVAALRSQIEELQRTDEQAKSTGRAQYLDLDSRLNRLEGGSGTAPAGEPAAAPADEALAEQPPASNDGAPAASVGGGAAAAASPGIGERASYEAAFDVLKAGRYDESARQFDQFLQQHPEGAYAPNARYWLGESYYVTQNYELALEQFKLIYDRYPNHDKAAGALLKVGLSQYGLERMDDARVTLTQVTEKFPGSDAARTAQDRLRAIDLAGR